MYKKSIQEICYFVSMTKSNRFTYFILFGSKVEGVQGQRVMPPQAGNYRSKTKDRFLPNFKF